MNSDQLLSSKTLENVKATEIEITSHTQTALHKVLREEYGIFIDVRHDNTLLVWAVDEDGEWNLVIYRKSAFESYEDSMEAGLYHGTKIIARRIRVVMESGIVEYLKKSFKEV